MILQFSFFIVAPSVVRVWRALPRIIVLFLSLLWLVGGIGVLGYWGIEVLRYCGIVASDRGR